MDFVDIRSDTVTVPTLKMREAMRDAKVGDDVFGEDPTIKELTQTVAEMFGKEAAIFVPSGVMSNQLALLTWTTPGDEVIMWENCHISIHENGTIGRLSGVQARTISSESGILKPQEGKGEMEPYIRKNKSILEPKTSLLCLENSLGNGRVWPVQDLKNIKALADKYELKIHTDGARIFNAAAVSGVKVNELAKYTDSISFCLSKGLCCAVGSLLVGSKEFIAKANYNKKAIGGGIRQGGILAAAGLVAFKEIVPHIPEDHKMARLLAERLSKIEGIRINLDKVISNMVFFDFDESVGNLEGLSSHLLLKKIKTNPAEQGRTYRFVTHHYIREKEVQSIVTEVEAFIKANR